MARILAIWIAVVILPLTPVCCAGEVFPVVHSEPVTVRILDGRDGKPQPQRRVVLTGGYDRRDLGLGQWREEALTDSEGNVHLSNNLRSLPLLRVEVVKSHACDPNVDQAAFSVDRIRLDGLSGVNRCGMAVAAEAAGVFTVFVKALKRAAPARGLISPAAAPVSLAAPAPAPMSAPHPMAASTPQPNFDKPAHAVNVTNPASAAVSNQGAVAGSDHAPASGSDHEAATLPASVSGPFPEFLSFPVEGSFVDTPVPPFGSAPASARLSAPAAPRIRPRVHAVVHVSGRASVPDAPPKQQTAVHGKPSTRHTAKDAQAEPGKPVAGHVPEPSAKPAVNGKPAAGTHASAAILPSAARVHALQHQHSTLPRLGLVSPQSARTERSPVDTAEREPNPPLHVSPPEMPVFRLRAHPPNVPSVISPAPSTVSSESSGPAAQEDFDPLCVPDGN